MESVAKQHFQRVDTRRGASKTLRRELILPLIAARMPTRHCDVPQPLPSGPRKLHYGLSRDSFETPHRASVRIRAPRVGSTTPTVLFVRFCWFIWPGRDMIARTRSLSLRAA